MNDFSKVGDSSFWLTPYTTYTWNFVLTALVILWFFYTLWYTLTVISWNSIIVRLYAVLYHVLLFLFNSCNWIIRQNRRHPSIHLFIFIGELLIRSWQIHTSESFLFGCGLFLINISLLGRKNLLCIISPWTRTTENLKWVTYKFCITKFRGPMTILQVSEMLKEAPYNESKSNS